MRIMYIYYIYIDRDIEKEIEMETNRNGEVVGKEFSIFRCC